MDYTYQETPKLDIKVFDKKGSFPFKEVDCSERTVYEINDQTMRTPLEKADVFNELLKVSVPCELWILPVTEEITSVMETIEEERTAALFQLLSSVKDTMQRDRMFILADQKDAEILAGELKALGFTLLDTCNDHLADIEVSY